MMPCHWSNASRRCQSHSPGRSLLWCRGATNVTSGKHIVVILTLATITGSRSPSTRKNGSGRANSQKDNHIQREEGKKWLQSVRTPASTRNMSKQTTKCTALHSDTHSDRGRSSVVLEFPEPRPKSGILSLGASLSGFSSMG